MTLGEMVTQCITRLGWESTNVRLVARVKSEINAAYRTVRAKRNWDWLLSSEPLAITGDTAAITLPTNCRSVFHVELRSTGRVLEPVRMDLESIKGGALTYRGRGTPTAWYIIAGALYTVPYPAGVDTLDILFYKTAVDLSANSDEPEFGEDYHQLLVEDAMSRLAAQDSFDPTIADRAWSSRNELMRALMHTGRPVATIPKYMPRLVGQFGG